MKRQDAEMDTRNWIEQFWKSNETMQVHPNFPRTLCRCTPSPDDKRFAEMTLRRIEVGDERLYFETGFCGACKTFFWAHSRVHATRAARGA